MRSSTNRLAATLLAVLLLAAPAMAASAAPERGHGADGWGSTLTSALTDLSNLWDGVVGYFTAASQGSTVTSPPTDSGGTTSFDPNGLATTTPPPDGSGDVVSRFDPDG